MRAPTWTWCSASCHDEQELAHAAALGLDFVVLGPVQATPTHPDAQLLGWERFARMIARLRAAGVCARRLAAAEHCSTACAAGAHGVAMIRGAWSATSVVSFGLVGLDQARVERWGSGSLPRPMPEIDQLAALGAERAIAGWSGSTHWPCRIADRRPGAAWVRWDMQKSRTTDCRRSARRGYRPAPGGADCLRSW